MKPEALARHMHLPAGISVTSGAVVTLAQCQDNPSDLITPSLLSDAQMVALVKACWLAGEWNEIFYGAESIDRDRAIRELEAQSDIGRHLMSIELRAIEMVHEDAVQQGGD